MKDSLIVLSGGLDSTTMLYEYRYRIGMAVSFHYGSNHNDRELEYAKLHCERLGIPHLVIRLPFIKEFFKSSLLEGADAIPEGNYDEQNMKSTVVPFRNGIMLSIAAGIAENNKMQYVMLANHAGDHTIYPDCRSDFVEAMNNAIHFGTWNGVQLLTPYTHLTKAEIASKGKELNINYAETWSCYKGGEHHCGVCGTCRERKEALAQAGIEDNTVYDN
ncbi:MAG: 7-cyano-7-deazaguanine synthase QueC [Paludibacteraceae bacterium]|nr:7-cyano-7-deazaguanine synthase QueC [Paludibacteraceae bacterium]